MMHNFLCWEPNAVRQVINPYAEHISDSLFRAVHTDWDLKVAPRVGKRFQDITEASWSDLTPAAFLEDFLRPENPHVLAAILGESGSGKSHLVHWMRLAIKPDPSRVVIVVRKSGTSLRNIVRMIISELPEDQQRGFLETLQSAGDGTQSREDQKQQLLNDLAQAIREEVLPPEADEVEQELKICLPDLFQDPHMRKAHFLDDRTVVAEIVDHIFAPSNAGDRPENRRSFVETDLPLGGLDFANASRLAQNAIEVIEYERHINLPLAVKIINRNLDRAIARTLSFSGDRVEELMTRLRSYLRSQNKELILLIEEFARLQGIDRPLLQAITSLGDENLCKIRTAMAVTTGFFESVAETAYARTTHIVDMNRSAGRSEGGKVTRDSLSQFTARYLNAVRLGRKGIDEWNATALPGERPHSHCEKCTHQNECHAIFGAVDNYGLYPFTSKALWNAASRVDEEGMPDKINPRILQNDLLAEVLDNFGPEISTGQFPSPRLLEKLRGIRVMSSVAQRDLERRNPQNFKRWAAFLEIYDGTGAILNLDPRLHQALNVPEIPGVGEVIQTDNADDIVETPPPPPRPSLNPDDILIEQWVQGVGLDQALATRLRRLIFSAISNGIDWDMLGLAKSTFVGSTGRAFQTSSISFERQTTQVRGDLQVKLIIPGDIPWSTVGAALRGVLQASRKQFSWDFEDGDQMLAAFLDCVEVWSRSVEEQLLRICNPSPKWNQGAAAVELLCVGAAIGGKIKSGGDIAEMIDGAFSANWPAECASTAPEMKSLYDRLLKNRDKLTSIALSQMASMKGGRVGAMLNPGKILPSIRTLRLSKYRLTQDPPMDDLQDPAKLYREVHASIAIAAASELAQRQSWLNRMLEAFGENVTRAAVVAALDEARTAVADAGIGTQNTSRILGDVLDQFKMVQFDDTISAARALLSEEDPVAALPHFGRGRRAAVETGTTLVNAAKAFLDAVDQTITGSEQSLGSQQGALGQSLEQIERALNDIALDITSLDTGNAEPDHAA
jgi:energy-coupling factor transporter ATP-binding protein EcfA2